MGYENKNTIRDCGSLRLEPNEQVTFLTENGAEYDVARKDFGFYATPSINGRLAGFGFRTALVKNRDDRYFLMLVEKDKQSEFASYLEKEPLSLICWLDDNSSLKKIESAFRNIHG